MNQTKLPTKNQALRLLDVVLCLEASTELSRPQLVEQLFRLAANENVSRIIILHEDSTPQLLASFNVTTKVDFIHVDAWFSGLAMARLLETATRDMLLVMPTADELEIEKDALKEFIAVAAATGAGLVYSDFRVIRDLEVIEYTLCDYQLGSIRETFDFGGIVLIAREAAQEALRRYGQISPELIWAGFYDLRLKLSTDFLILRIPQALYIKRERRTVATLTSQPGAQHSPTPSDSGMLAQRMEIEQIATEHLRRIGASLEPVFLAPPPPDGDYPLTASVVIPVRNREQTIAEAIRSALGQKTSFAYNVIVVDDRSTDRTSAIIEELARQHDNLVHLIPKRTDLGVGGLWNHAIYSTDCGLFAVQLDSDDVYADSSVLQKIVDKFWEAPVDGDEKRAKVPRYAMVIGSFSQVNFKLEDIPGKFIRHRDIAGENGCNNALRIDGMGAPRAFYVPLLRQLGFPNVSFGEDYAVCLRLSREYEMGRIFECLYLARKWEGNTIRSLPLGSTKSIDFRDLMPVGTTDAQGFFGKLRPVIVPLRNASKRHYLHYKDWLRTMEIRERINLNRQRSVAGVDPEPLTESLAGASQREFASSLL